MSVAENQALVSPRAAFQYRDFRLFQSARFLSIVGTEIQSLAVAWQIYELTRSPLHLGYVGLTQFLPSILLFLVVGHAADRFDRRRILLVCHFSLVICSGVLLWLSLQPRVSIAAVYGLMTLVGMFRAFNGPASHSILPAIVPEHHFQNAVAWGSSVFMVATIMGPSLGGVVYALGQGARLAFAATSVLFATAFVLLSMLHIRTGRMEKESTSFTTMLAGLRYVWQRKLILGSISLDLFAVLLGGAVALLPVFADDILKIGAWGLGILRASPAVGAAMTGLLLAYRPIRRRAGSVMLGCVFAFGLATVIFGLSRSFTLSVLSLVLAGATDMVSVVLRATLVQLSTPPEMRGRVSAVNLLFIGASNELGQFESGITAHWFGTVPAVILGGVGSMAIVGLWAWLFPDLRRIDQLRSDYVRQAAPRVQLSSE